MSMDPWRLARAEVTYVCLGCDARVTIAVEPPNMTCCVSGVCTRCFSLMGITHVWYQTVDDETVNPTDSDAAAALGINLQPLGGANESSEDDNVH